MIWLAAFLLAAAAAEHYTRANAYFGQQRFTEAEAELVAALHEDPNLVAALTLKGKLAMALNRFDEAREAFVRAGELQPKSAYVQFLLGFFYYVDNDFQKAIPALEIARQLNPNDSRAVFYLALSQDGLGAADAAVPLYEKTIELEKSGGHPTPDVHVAYARLLFSLGRYEDAEKQVMLALGLDPKSRDAHYELGRLWFEKGEFAKAAAEGEIALAIPGVGTLDRQIHFLLARSYAKAGRKDLADYHLAKFKAAGVSLRR
ncbi:MAG: tetratricopeptide repeat protein [Bryobacteraceae bacterium]